MSNSNNNFIKYAKNSKSLEGGDIKNGNNTNLESIQTFISFIIIGYFGVKIVYSTFLQYYPDKFYHKSIEISKNDLKDNENDKNNKNNKNNLVISTYIPNYWNNEFVDFITLLTLSFIIYIFSNFNSKDMITKNGVISPSFFVGYMIGLGYPIYKKYTTIKNEENSSTSTNSSNTILGGILFMIAIVAIVSNYSTNEDHSVNVSIYFVTIFILLYGLYLTRKKSESKLSTKVYNSKNDKCASSTSGIILTSGEKLNLNIPFISFIILLLFKYDPHNSSFKYAIYLLFGILLGIFVSSISYFGIEYFLEKTPEKMCNDVNECEIKDIKYENKSFYEITKEYINQLFGTNLSNESKNILTKAKSILEEEYIINENKKMQNESIVDKIAKNLNVKKSRSFVDTFKYASFTLLILLILYLIYLVIFKSMP
jgi:hypothetical protein